MTRATTGQRSVSTSCYYTPHICSILPHALFLTREHCHIYLSRRMMRQIVNKPIICVLSKYRNKGQVALEDKSVYLCQKNCHHNEKPSPTGFFTKGKNLDKLQRRRRLPLEQAKAATTSFLAICGANYRTFCV